MIDLDMSSSWLQDLTEIIFKSNGLLVSRKCRQIELRRVEDFGELNFDESKNSANRTSKNQKIRIIDNLLVRIQRSIVLRRRLDCLELQFQNLMLEMVFCVELFLFRQYLQSMIYIQKDALQRTAQMEL